MSVGVTIKNARVALGLTTADLASSTKIRESMLVALEADEFDSFGGEAYVRGHLKVLANCLGLDPEGLAGEFDELQSQVSAFERY
jgi:cytoskeleton protein RodZ